MPSIITKRKGDGASGASSAPAAGELPAEGVTARPIPYLLVFFFGWLCGALARSLGADLGPSRREW